MSRLSSRFAVLIFFLLSFGIALFVQVYLQSRALTILDHSFRLDSAFFLVWAGISALALFSWVAGARLEARVFQEPPASRLWAGFLASLPLSLFLATPWLLRFYTTRTDLRLRLRLLAFFILGAIALLKFFDLSRLKKKKCFLFDRLTTRFFSLPLHRQLRLLFLIAFILYVVVAALLVVQGVSFTGDEPFYLLTSHSLLKDGDINLANNYAHQDYFAFYSKKENPRLKLWPYGRYGRQGPSTLYPINLPGISVLMLPFYWLSQFFSGRWLTFILKISLSPWAVLLGLQVYLYARELGVKERLALGLWALYSLSSPILFYATHLYPEVPIALFSIYIFRKISRPKPLSNPQLLWLGFILALFPWFGLKYNFIFWPLLLIAAYLLTHEHRAGLRILVFLALPLVSTVLFYSFVHVLYGTFSPIAIYEGVLTPERTEAFKQTVLQIPLRARLDAFLDYFLDQRDGLLLYSPWYFFAFFGFIDIYRRRRRDFWCFFLLSLPYLLNYAFFTHRQGASPQGRVLTPLSWIAALAAGSFLVHNRRQVFSFLFGMATAASFIVTALLLVHPSFLYQPTTHEFTSRPGDLFVHLSNLHFFLPPFLPSFIKVDNTRYWPNYVWLLAILVGILLYALFRQEKPLARWIPPVFTSGALVASFFLWVLYPRTPLHPTKTIRYSNQKALGFYTFPIGKGVVSKENGDFYLHFEKNYKFVFSSRTPLRKIRLILGSEKGDYSIQVSFFDLPVLEARTTLETREFVFEPATFYSYRNLFLYELNVCLTHHSSESMLLDPYLFQVIP